MEPEEKKRDWISVIEERENICMNPDIWEIWSKEEVKEAVEQTSPAAAPVYLVEGACVQCSKMLPAMFNVRIKVLMKSFDLIYREKWLKDTDTFFQPASFGCCGNPQTPCQPVVQTWLGCSLKTLVGLRPVLTMDSYLICQKGGIITPKTDGQNAVATLLYRPIITLVACHRINRYNDMRTEKGKGFRTLIFCREACPETFIKAMVIISKYEVEYKKDEDIFNQQ